MAITCKEFVFWVVERDREGRKKEKKLLYEDFTIE
jgi:hypothetical protein